ncbi:hypothetical protein [Dactylosporangium sp. CS-033363]
MLDRDLTPLIELIRRNVRVGLFVDYPGYTHTSKQIQDAQD